METVVLTIRPMNIAVIALMVAVVLVAYYGLASAGGKLKNSVGS